MNQLSRTAAAPAPTPAPSAQALLSSLSSTAVRRAIMDARAGLPVLIQGPDGGATIMALAAETATPASLAYFLETARTEPQLVLAPSRAETLLPSAPPSRRDAAAFRLPPGKLTQPSILAMADPTRPQTGHLAWLPASPLALAGAALSLAKLARLLPAMLLAEGDASAALITVSATHIIGHQSRADTTLHRVAEAALPLAEAEHARLIAYRPDDGGTEHVALLIGRPEDIAEGAEAPLVRIHSECFTGDLLGSLRCDCGPQLHQAIRRMQAEGAGVLLYMAQEGRGIGLVNKLRAYALQDRGLDTLDANRALGWGADERDFAASAVMLRDLGITRVRLLTNNPDKVAALEEAGITVAGRLRHAIAANGVNDGYLETKARRFGHLLG